MEAAGQGSERRLSASSAIGTLHGTDEFALSQVSSLGSPLIDTHSQHIDISNAAVALFEHCSGSCPFRLPLLTKETGVASNRKRAPPRNDTETVIDQALSVHCHRVDTQFLDRAHRTGGTLVLVASR